MAVANLAISLIWRLRLAKLSLYCPSTIYHVRTTLSNFDITSHTCELIQFNSKITRCNRLISNNFLHITQTEDYNHYIKKEGTKELNNIVKTSNSYTIPTVSYNAN